jgi:multisubunit Na+/H+ antiporter MnhF subunit
MTQAIAWCHATMATLFMVYGVREHDQFMMDAAIVEALVAIACAIIDGRRS